MCLTRVASYAHGEILTPVVKNIATIIVSALMANDIFCLYHVSTLILIKSFNEIKNSYYHSCCQNILKNATNECLKMHKKHQMCFMMK